MTTHPDHTIADAVHEEVLVHPAFGRSEHVARPAAGPDHASDLDDLDLLDDDDTDDDADDDTDTGVDAPVEGPEAHFVNRHDPFLPLPSVVPASWGDEDLGALFGLPDESSWQERALCAQTDPEAFFPEKGGSTREAKRVCTGCEVKAQCLEYALENDERFGIWGGLSERERRRLKRRAI